MSTHVRVFRSVNGRTWGWTCLRHKCRGYGLGFKFRHSTHAEALAAAWAHIKEHS